MLPSTTPAPAERRSPGVSPFTVPFVPTGMKVGVSTSPCGVRSLPTRASPSRASTLMVTGALKSVPVHR
nr:hypothetical protein [Rubrobacter marinus]